MRRQRVKGPAICIIQQMEVATGQRLAASTTSQATYSVVITGTALTSLQVITCSFASTSAGTTTTTIYDIWTAGTYTPGYIMPRFIRSVFHKQRHKTKRILLARGANVVGPAGQ